MRSHYSRASCASLDAGPAPSADHREPAPSPNCTALTASPPTIVSAKLGPLIVHSYDVSL